MKYTELRKKEAEQRFREGTDDYEDREVLRHFKIDWMTIEGGQRCYIPTVEEEEEPDAGLEAEDRYVPTIWKASKNRAPGKGHVGESVDE